MADISNSRQDVDQTNTHWWLHNAGLKVQTEGFIMTMKP